MPTLERINVTPVKGMALHHPDRVEITSAGIPGDRRFYLVGASGKMVSGSTFGSLVRIVADHDPQTEELSMRFPDGTVVAGRADHLGEAEVTDFFRRPVAAHAVDGPWSEAVSEYLGTAVRLLRTDHDGEAVDVLPLTVISTASVRDLAERGHHDGSLDSRRFRINLELDGCGPYDEDSWDGETVGIGEVRLRIEGAIPRCLVTNQSPDTGTKDWNTLTQIAKYRPRIKGDGGLPFGMYGTVVQPGVAHLGDTVQVPSHATSPD
ncbi:MAG TPA: MOSC N-terminal beta barrel domain-containing protein [Actinomycetota bacterium]